MKIAVLAWGSLVWDKRNLKIKNDWQSGGIKLPIEFARISRDGRLTLVITEDHGTEIETHWTISDYSDLEKAIDNLREREGTNKRGIGYVNVLGKDSSSNLSEDLIKNIENWAKNNELDGVIWTDLKSNFEEKSKMNFSLDNAMKYYHSLKGESKKKAIEYIQNAPKLTMTKLRKKLQG